MDMNTNKRKDIINFTGGFILGFILLWALFQTSLQQANQVINRAYKLCVEMEEQLLELRSLRNKTNPKNKIDERVI